MAQSTATVVGEYCHAVKGPDTVKTTSLVLKSPYITGGPALKGLNFGATSAA